MPTPSAVDGLASEDLNERLLLPLMLLLLPTPDAAPLLMLCVRETGYSRCPRPPPSMGWRAGTLTKGRCSPANSAAAAHARRGAAADDMRGGE